MNSRVRLITALGSNLRRTYVQLHAFRHERTFLQAFKRSVFEPLVPKPSQRFASSTRDPTPKRDVRSEPKHTVEWDSSSSSESDSAPSDDEAGESVFWRQKMRTHHQAIDVNKDGTVSWDDFELLSQRFEILGNLDEAQRESFRSVLRDYWEEYWGASADPYAVVMQEDFLRSMHHVVNTPDLRKKVAKPLPYFFRAVDHDGSGEISVDEFKLFFKCLGMTEAAAVTSFKVIDTNGDGKLSVEEFVRLGEAFFLSEDESHPSKLFWGPLVQ